MKIFQALTRIGLTSTLAGLSLISSFMGFLNEAKAQSVCTIGETRKIKAIDQLNVIAQWDERDKINSAIYNPPMGWMIIGHQVEDLSGNNGWINVSLLDGGLNYMSEKNSTNVYKSLINAAAQAQNYSAKAELEQELDQRISEYRKYSTNKNTLEATVHASGRGNFFDRIRGWQKINVYTTEKCFGVNDPSSLANSLAIKYGLSLTGEKTSPHDSSVGKMIQAIEFGGLCLDIANPEGKGPVNGAQVVAWQCHGGANQKFQVQNDGTIKATEFGGLCLDIANPEGKGPVNGAQVVAWQCHGGANQKFQVQNDGTIKATEFGGLCLDIANPEGKGPVNGAQVVAWQCHGGTNQRWTLK